MSAKDQKRAALLSAVKLLEHSTPKLPSRWWTTSWSGAHATLTWASANRQNVPFLALRNAERCGRWHEPATADVRSVDLLYIWQESNAS